MHDLHFIQFKQAFINESSLRMIFEINGSDIEVDFSLMNPQRIQKMYAMWNGKTINKDFKAGTELTKFLNKTMALERLCRVENGRIKECYQPVVIPVS
ncbi:MAG: hypothetical protein ACTHMM_21255 [Agriterribacter sp.]